MTQPLRPPDLIDDERLARLVTAGNSQAFSVLYERYHDRLYRYCRSILHSEADAHDAVQSTFTRALEALQQDLRNAPVRPWLFRIAHNEAISAIRHRRARELLAAHVEPGGSRPRTAQGPEKSSVRCWRTWGSCRSGSVQQSSCANWADCLTTRSRSCSARR